MQIKTSKAHLLNVHHHQISHIETRFQDNKSTDSMKTMALDQWMIRSTLTIPRYKDNPPLLEARSLARLFNLEFSVSLRIHRRMLIRRSIRKLEIGRGTQHHISKRRVNLEVLVVGKDKEWVEAEEEEEVEDVGVEGDRRHSLIQVVSQRFRDGQWYQLSLLQDSEKECSRIEKSGNKTNKEVQIQEVAVVALMPADLEVLNHSRTRA